MLLKIATAIVWSGLCVFLLIALFDWYSSAIKIKPRWLRWIAYLLPVVIFAGSMVWGD